MVTLREAIVQGTRDFICNFAQADQDFLSYVRGATEQGTGLTIPTTVAEATANTIAALACSDADCGSTAPCGPIVDYPCSVLGGQCPGVLYVLSGTYERTVFVPGAPDSVTVRNWSFASVAGPVSDVFIEQTSNARTIVAIDGGGNRVNMVSGTGSNQVWANLSPTTASPASGGANNCGDSCGPPQSTHPLPYDPGDGTPISPPVEYIASPIVLLPGGGIIVPIVINGPNFNIVANTNINTGDVVLDFGGGGGLGSSLCCLAGDLLDQILPETLKDPEPRNEELVIRGLVITTTSIGANIRPTEMGVPDGPSTWMPRLGTVNFAVVIGRQLAWTEDIDIKNEKQYIQVPGDKVARNWAIRAEPGVTFDVTPEYVNLYVD